MFCEDKQRHSESDFISIHFISNICYIYIYIIFFVPWKKTSRYPFKIFVSDLLILPGWCDTTGGLNQERGGTWKPVWLCGRSFSGAFFGEGGSGCFITPQKLDQGWLLMRGTCKVGSFYVYLCNFSSTRGYTHFVKRMFFGVYEIASYSKNILSFSNLCEWSFESLWDSISFIQKKAQDDHLENTFLQETKKHINGWKNWVPHHRHMKWRGYE